MKSFYQMDNMIKDMEFNKDGNGLGSYEKDFSRVGGSELKPLTDEDMSQVSADDFAAMQELRKKMGINPTKLGDPMTDEEFQKFQKLG